MGACRTEMGSVHIINYNITNINYNNYNKVHELYIHTHIYNKMKINIVIIIKEIY